MQKFLRTPFLLVALIVILFVSGAGQASAQTTGTVSPYASKPVCPAMRDNEPPTTCTYTNGDTASCVQSSNPLLGISTLTCTNPDRSTSVCEALNGQWSQVNQCRVTNADGTSGGGTGDSTVPGVRTDTVTDSNGNVTETNNTSASCSVLNVAQCIANLPGMLFAALAFLLLGLSGIILAIAGTVFNWVVIRTVFQFGTYFGTSDSMLITWGVIRDLGNIALLFGFIFVGVATILNTQGTEGFTAKKALPRLIIFAVLLNFSLFASQGVIDVANGFGSVFTTLAGQDCKADTSSVGGTGTAAQDGQSTADCSNVGISGKVLEAAGLTKIFDTTDKSGEFFQNLTDRPYTYTLMLLVLSVFVTVTAMVLLAGTVMLVIRVVVLSLLMVTSPIGFAGMAIPPLQKLAKDWWHKLISQSFFAPVFLLMIFISLKLVENLTQQQASIVDALLGNSASTGATTAGNMQVIMVFAIVIGFMIAALVVAQKMGAYGAKFATQRAAGLTLGAHAFVARRTIGRASGKVAERIRSSSFGHTETGRLFAGIADKGAKSSFDGRGISGLQKVGGLDLGKPQKGGYDAIVHHGQEEREKYGKSLKQTAGDKAKERAFNDNKKALEAEKARSSEQKEQAKRAAEKEKLPLEQQAATLAREHSFKAKERDDERALQQTKYQSALTKDGPEAEAAIAKEEEALRALSAAHRDAARAESEEVEAIKTQIREKDEALKVTNDMIDGRAKVIDAQIKAIDSEIKGKVDENGHVVSTGVGSNAASYRYAADLHRTSTSPVNLATAGHRASHHASASIIRNAGKSKIEKALGDIKDATEKVSEHTDDHGSDDHGGGGGAKPAAGGHDDHAKH